MSSALEEKFLGAVFDIYQRAKSEAGYTAAVFLKMLSDRGCLDTAKYLINSNQPSDRYTALWQRGHLSLTVEAMVVEQARWHELFLPEEIERARTRRLEYHYDLQE